ncbi:hypothetical protein [Nitratireductor sp. L15S-10]|uniref:hypothetical protein n=1 Tax=Nitratireductor sp. L15S-10 TaxID=3034028 RepID=UPI0038571B93
MKDASESDTPCRELSNEDAMNSLEQMTLEDSRGLGRKRARKNLLVMLLLVGFVGAVFFASFGHIVSEMRPAGVESQPE